MSQSNFGSTTVGITLRARVRALIAARGTVATAALLGVSRHALERAVAGLPIRRGTAALISRIYELTSAPATHDDTADGEVE